MNNHYNSYKISTARAILLISLIIFFAGDIAKAQQIAEPSKKHPSFNYERLARIDTLVNDYLQKKWITGVVTLIVKDNQIIQYKSYGHADVATKRPMPKDAIFRIMSQTKAITSAGVLILYEQGKLLLDEPISNFIPEFKNPKVIDTYNPADTSYTTVPAKREITFRDLLTHTSGIGYPAIGQPMMTSIYAKAKIPSGLGYFDADLLTEMKSLARLPLAHQPGEKYMYGINTDLLGGLIEVISGLTLNNFLKKNIFDPLGMRDTYFTVPAAKSGRMPTVYTEDNAQKIIEWAPTFRNIDPKYPLMEKKYFSGGAGLSSTALDYAIFLQMILNGGTYNNRQILSPNTCKIMTSPQLDFPYKDPDDFGLGFAITSEKSAARKPRNAGSFNWGGYFGTNSWVDPEEKMICLIMTQQNPNSHNDLVGKFEVLIYAALKE